MIRYRHVACTLVVSLLVAATASAANWPQWRSDAARSGVGDEQLPEKLARAWTINYSRRRQAWKEILNLDRITYDRVLEPVIADGRIFIGFNDTDKVVALDVKTGRELWRFYTGGPVRLPLCTAAERSTPPATTGISTAWRRRPAR